MSLPRVLVIDDDVGLADMYRLWLELEGWLVTLAHDGAEGAKLVRSLPDIVLLDVQLPPAGGLAVLDAVRTNPATASLPVVMLSNCDDPETVEAAMRRGARNYLVKSRTPLPLLANQLRSMVANPPHGTSRNGVHE